jgi:hypothetical protein
VSIPSANRLHAVNRSYRLEQLSLITNFSLSSAVYGPENVTSGASSDLQHATSTATRMVKVRHPLSPFITCSAAAADVVTFVLISYTSTVLWLLGEDRPSILQ